MGIAKSGMGILTGVSLFSGAGGLDIAARNCGIKTVCYVENDRYAQGVLMSRIREGALDDAPIWDDVKTFDGKPSGKVDIVFGGFPCQDVSNAGKRKGLKEGTRSGLWFEFARILREIRPRYVLVENVPGLIIRGFDDVLGELAEMGYDAEWEMLSACEVGAPHMRKRVLIMAYADGFSGKRMEKDEKIIRSREYPQCSSWWKRKSLYLRIPVVREKTIPSPGVHRVDDGLAEELDRFRLCGNGVVPQCAEIAFRKIIRRGK